MLIICIYKNIWRARWGTVRGGRARWKELLVPKVELVVNEGSLSVRWTARVIWWWLHMLKLMIQKENEGEQEWKENVLCQGPPPSLPEIFRYCKIKATRTCRSTPLTLPSTSKCSLGWSFVFHYPEKATMSAGQRLTKFFFTSESVSEGHPGSPSFFFLHEY